MENFMPIGIKFPKNLSKIPKMINFVAQTQTQ